MSGSPFSCAATVELNSSLQTPSPSLLVVFDSRVADLEVLYQALVPDAIPYVLDAQMDALSTLTTLLAETGATRLAIVAHGEPGIVHLGAKPLTLQAIQDRSVLLQNWNVEEILLYSCEVAKGEIGRSFVVELGELTGASVAAAEIPVGNADLGGSWDLKGATAMPGSLLFLPTAITHYKTTLGNEFRVNSNSSIGLYQAYSSVTALSDGGFVVTWSSAGQDGSGWGIYGQRYNASGATVGSEFRINSYISSDQIYSSVTALNDGGFVVTWSSAGQDGSSYGIYGQRYNASGATVGSEFRINSYISNQQNLSSVTALNDGGFVVTWSSAGQDGSGLGIYGQRYNASGAAVSAEFRINSFIPNDQIYSSVTALNDGGFVVTWSSVGQDNSPSGIYGQRYNASGAAVSAEFRINSFIPNDQVYSSVTALNDGGFVVTWSSVGQDGSGWGIYGQRYNASGVAVGSEFRINSFIPNDQAYSSVTALNDGGFAVIWSSYGQDGSGWGIYGQQFNAQGSKIGNEFLVNQFTGGDQSTGNINYYYYYYYYYYVKSGSQNITTLNNGDIVVTWEGSSATDGDGINARILTLPPSNTNPSLAVPAPINLVDTASNDTFSPVSGNLSASDPDGNPLIYGISGGTGGTTLVQNLVVDSRQNVAPIGQPKVFSNSLTAGVQYRIVVSGTWQPDSFYNPNWNVDARYVTPNGWSYFQDFDPLGHGDLGLHSDALGGDEIWGAYQSNHTYSAVVTGQGSPIDFYVRDVNYSDNSGSYQVAIYQIQPVTKVGTYGTLTLNPVTGQYTYTPNDGAIEALKTNTSESFTVTASDGSGGTTSKILAINITGANDIPTLTAAIIDQSATQDTAFTFTLPVNTFSDIDAGDVLTYSATLENGDPLPNWLSFNAETQTFSGTPTNNDVATINVKVTASDGQDSVSDVFQLAIANTNDAPIVSNAIADQSASEDNLFTFALPANTFTDADGDVLAYSATLADESPLPNWLTFDADTQTFSGIPDNSQVGPLNIKVTATDPNGAIATDEFTLEISNTNDAPVVGSAIADQTAIEGLPFSLALAAETFTDPDGDSLFYTASLSDGSALPSWLTFDSTTRTLNGTPDDADLAPLNIKVTATDPSGAAQSQVFQLAVTAIDDPTTINIPTSQTIDEDTTLVFSSATGNAITLTDVDSSNALFQVAILSLNGDGFFSLGDTSGLTSLVDSRSFSGTLAAINAALEGASFSPSSNFNGNATLQIMVSNLETMMSASNIIAIQVNPVNDAPLLNLGIAPTVNEDEPFSFNFFAAVDPDDNFYGTIPIAYSAKLADGSSLPAWISFDPETRTFSGTATNANVGSLDIEVTASDGEDSASQVFTLTVNNTNDAPTQTGPLASLADGNEDTAYLIDATDLLTGFSDIDGDSLSVSGLTATQGSLADNNDGTWTFTPDANYNGPVSLSYSVIDGKGGSVSAMQSFSIATANDAPTGTATATLVNGLEDNDYTIDTTDLLIGFTDADGDSLAVTDLSVDTGELTNNDDGTYTFIPNANFNGSVNLSYTVEDGNGGSIAATQSLTIAAVNDAPVANDNSYSMDEDTSISSTVLANDTDIESHPLTAVLVDGPTHGELIFETNGLFIYSPDDDFVGTDSFTYVANDGTADSNIATVTITVNNINDAPIQTGTLASLANSSEDTAYTISKAQLLQGFSDADSDPLSITNFSTSNGSFVENPDGSFTITPTPNFNGTVSIAYQVSDGTVSVAASNSFYLIPTNDAPEIDLNGAATGFDYATTFTEDGGSVAIVSPDLTLTDVDANATANIATVRITNLLDGNAEILAADTTGTNITASYIGSPFGILELRGQDSVANYQKVLRSVTYNNTAQNPTLTSRSIQFSVNDSMANSNQAFTTLAIVAANDGPTGTATATLSDGIEDNNYTISAANLLQGFSDPDGDTLAVANLTANQGSLVDNSDGTWTFTPDANYNGPVSLSYGVIDGNGGSVAAMQSFSIAEVNDAPTGTATAVLPDGAEDTAYTVNISDLVAGFSDVDGDMLSVSDLTATQGSLVANNNGTYTFTPNANFNGVVNLSYNVIDGNGGSVAATRSFSIGAANDAPTGSATATLSNGLEDTDYIIITSDLLTGFTDAEGDLLAITNLSATNGTLVNNNNGTYRFTPNANFNGLVDLSYQVIDGNGGSIAATQSLMIDAVNDNPVAVNDTLSTNENTPLTFNASQLLSNDSDLDSDILSIASTTAPTNGTLTNNNNGTYTYTPNAYYYGADSFSYTVSDGKDSTSTATVNLTVVQRSNLIRGTVGIDKLNGTNRMDVMEGLAGNDTLKSLGDNDVLDGGLGNDYLDGGLGDDTMIGGAGDDTYLIDSIGDTITEAPNEGVDRVQSSISYMLDAEVEYLTLTGTSATSGTGNNLNNRITGNGAANTLNGEVGIDTLIGGSGDDILNGGGDNDTLRGDQGDDLLRGGLGADRLTGGDGKDTFHLTRDGNFDTITDFNRLTDKIVVLQSEFSQFSVGNLPSSAFRSGSAAIRAGAQFVYNARGELFFDEDGVGGNAQVKIAALSGRPSLTAANITIA